MTDRAPSSLLAVTHATRPARRLLPLHSSPARLPTSYSDSTTSSCGICSSTEGGTRMDSRLCAMER